MDTEPVNLSDAPSLKEEKLQLSEISEEDDDKPKKKKKKHKNKKKRKKEKKQQKRKDSENDFSDLGRMSKEPEIKDEGFKREEIEEMKRMSRSR